MDFSRTKFSLGRHPLSYSKVRKAYGPIARKWPIRKTPADGAYLNIGAGPHARADFFNIDYDYHSGIDLFWDLHNPFPFASNLIGGIFTEHCLEHIPFDTTQQVLREFCRVLKPGASVRISVPDGETYARSYAEGRPMPFAGSELDRDADWQPMQSVNMAFYGHGHRFIYDFATMRVCLEKAGFSAIKKETMGRGKDPRLLIDQPERECESLYVEATKPA